MFLIREAQVDSWKKEAICSVPFLVVVLWLSVPAFSQADHAVQPVLDLATSTEAAGEFWTFSAWDRSSHPSMELPPIPSLGGPMGTISPDAERQVSLKGILRDIGHDQRRIWTFPVAAAHGQHWKPILGFVAVTSALVVADPHDTPYFRRTQDLTVSTKSSARRTQDFWRACFRLFSISPAWREKTLTLAALRCLREKLLGTPRSSRWS